MRPPGLLLRCTGSSTLISKQHKWRLYSPSAFALGGEAITLLLSLTKAASNEGEESLKSIPLRRLQLIAKRAINQFNYSGFKWHPRRPLPCHRLGISHRGRIRPPLCNTTATRSFSWFATSAGSIWNISATVKERVCWVVAAETPLQTPPVLTSDLRWVGDKRREPRRRSLSPATIPAALLGLPGWTTSTTANAGPSSANRFSRKTE